MNNAQGILDDLKAMKAQDKDEYLLDKSEGTITSALIGGGLGFLIAYNRKWNLLMGTIIGGAIAGMVSDYFVRELPTNIKVRSFNFSKLGEVHKTEFFEKSARIFE